jgi:hypothetical protein
MKKNVLPLHEMLSYDHIGLCAQAQKGILHEKMHSKEWGMMVFNMHKSIT